MNLPARLFILACLLPSFGLAQVYVADTFADGDRTSQDPPTSLAWFATFSSSVSVAPGALTVAPTSSTVRAASAYFTSPGAPVSLALGEVITYSITFTPATTASVSSPNGFRFGIFDSGGVRITSDTNPTDLAYPGYAAFVNPANSAARILERIGTGALITSLGTGIYGPTLVSGSGDGDTLNFEAGISYTVSLSVSRDLEDQWRVGFLLAGGGMGLHRFETEVAGNVSQFDTLSFGLNSDMGTLAITNVTVEVTAIPEPGSAALLAGSGLVVLLVGRHLRRRPSTPSTGGAA